MIFSKRFIHIVLILISIIHVCKTNAYAENENVQLAHIKFIGQAVLSTGYRLMIQRLVGFQLSPTTLLRTYTTQYQMTGVEGNQHVFTGLK